MSSITPGGSTDKHADVNRMFGRIAGRYDLMNTAMTLGLDGRWRRRAAEATGLPEGGMALDVGTGTGDLACELARFAPGALVVGLDYTGPMIAQGPAKARLRSVGGQTAWLQADGQQLPFPDGLFNAVTSAFVLRNFSDLDLAFAEMARVVCPGGRVVALEISPTGMPAWRRLFEPYFHHVVPRLGSLLAGDRTAYEYLPSSVAAFLSPESVAERMGRAGLAPLTPTLILGGSIVIHIGLKPPSSPTP